LAEKFTGLHFKSNDKIIQTVLAVTELRLQWNKSNQIQSQSQDYGDISARNTTRAPNNNYAKEKKLKIIKKNLKSVGK